jgi:hypothetical protein
MGPKTSLSSCPRDVFRDAIAHGVIAKRGGKKNIPARQHLSGYSRDGGHSNARVLEYVLPDGQVIGRLVEACGQIETWLERSVATDTLIARADAEAEVERIKKEMVKHIRRRDGEKQPETYVLSSACVHAAARHQSRIGRLWDQNSRGDRTRANLAHALDRAVKAEASK